MVENVIQIKSGITITVNKTAKIQKNTCAKKTVFGILLYVVINLVNIQEVLLIIQ